MDLVQRLILTLAVVMNPRGLRVVFHATEKDTRDEWDGGIFEVSPEVADKISGGSLTFKLIMAPKNMLAYEIPVTEYERLRDASEIVGVSYRITGEPAPVSMN
jgi:hypothetical protein